MTLLLAFACGVSVGAWPPIAVYLVALHKDGRRRRRLAAERRRLIASWCEIARDAQLDAE